MSDKLKETARKALEEMQARNGIQKAIFSIKEEPKSEGDIYDAQEDIRKLKENLKKMGELIERLKEIERQEEHQRQDGIPFAIKFFLFYLALFAFIAYLLWGAV